MLEVLFFVIGVLIALVFTKKPIQIKIHHVNEDIKPALNPIDMQALEDGMLKEDPATDKKYQDLEKLDQIMADVNEIMGGSDR